MIKKNKKNFTFIDLFAGIGGFHIALNNLGMRCVFASEIDKFARKTYEYNFKQKNPNIFKNYNEDITSLDFNLIPNFDILCAGFPCQPFSQAGFKKGFDDQRGNLFFSIVNIIKIKKPKVIFLENVRFLLKHNEGKTFNTIKKIIEDDLGYSFFYKIVKGTDFNVPQHRPRLVMIGFRNKKIKFDFPEPISLTKTMNNIFNGKCEKKIGYTVRVGGRGSCIKDRRNWDSYVVDGKVKKLGVNEAKEMMGFPKEFIFPVSEAQAMKQLGNSVIVPCIEGVAKNILLQLNKYYGNKRK